MKPSVSPFLNRARDLRHLAVSNQRGTLRLPHFRFTHPGASQRRIHVNRIGLDAIANTPLLFFEKIRRYDFVIVIRSVRE